MQYKKKVSGGGAWVDKSKLTNGQRAKIVSETEPQEGQYGSQDVAKVRFEGQNESVNVPINGGTMNALIDAFGEDSKDWMGKYLTIALEKMNVGGKRVTALYLIPEGYEMTEDDNGYVVIQKKTDNTGTVRVDDDSVNESQIPF